MTVLAEVPFAHLRLPAIYVAFHGKNPALGDILPARLDSPEALLAAARERLAYGAPEKHRAGIAKSLHAYAEKNEAPPAVFEAIESYAKPGTMAIVTGQQPGLLGGPLLVWHKIATALRVASELRALPGAPEIVVIFWNHSEDHDWGEGNHCFLANPSLDVQRVKLSRHSTGRPLDDVPIGEALEETMHVVSDLLPRTDFYNDVIEENRPPNAEATLGGQLGRLLFKHFGEKGSPLFASWELLASMSEELKSYQQSTDTLLQGQ